MFSFSKAIWKHKKHEEENETRMRTDFPRFRSVFPILSDDIRAARRRAVVSKRAQFGLRVDEKRVRVEGFSVRVEGFLNALNRV